MKLKLFLALIFFAVCLLALGGMTVRGARRAFRLGRGPLVRRRLPVARITRPAYY